MVDSRSERIAWPPLPGGRELRASPMNKKLIARFEGGSVYTAEEDGKYLVITDESSMNAFLDEEDQISSPIATHVFQTADERSRYVERRFKLKIT